MKKRLLSMLLVLTFILSMIPVSISAEEPAVSHATTPAQDGYTLVSGNSGDAINKTADGMYYVTRTAADKDTIVKKSGSVPGGWITLSAPVGTFLQMRRQSGIVFGADDINDLSKGTYYFAYRRVSDNDANPKIGLSKFVDGAETIIQDGIELKTVLGETEFLNDEAIDLEVYFTPEGIVKVSLNDICIISQNVGAIAGDDYGIRIAPYGGANGTNNFYFHDLSTKTLADFTVVNNGAIGLGEDGIMATKNSTLWLANDEIDADEIVYRFEISNYLNPSVDNNNSYTGLVFGVQNDEGNKAWEGAGISYYFLAFVPDPNNPQLSAVVLVRSSQDSADLFGIGGKWDNMKSVRPVDTVKGQYTADWMKAGNDINGHVYFNRKTGNIKVYLDGTVHNHGTPIICMDYTIPAEDYSKTAQLFGNG